MRYNCVNCGAPIDYEQNKCPYCGTYYFDLTTMTVGETVALKVNVPGKGKVFGRAILRDFNVDVESDDVIVTGGKHHEVIHRFRQGINASAKLKFDFVVNDDGELFAMIKDQDN